MSNNKQSMKLYTEEQVKKAIELAQECEHECGGVYFDYTEKEIIDELTPIELPSDSLCINCDDSKSTHNICMDCIIKIGKENIELPSDEEIENEAEDYTDKFVATALYAFELGAKWMRDKIKGGNNEQQ